MVADSKKVRLVYLLLSICIVSLAIFVTGKSVAQATRPLSSAQTTTNWSMYGFDARHTGYNPNETLLSPSTVSQLVPAWKQTTVYDISASPVVVNGIVYVVANDVLYAFRTHTGKTIWQVTLSSSTTSEAAPLYYNGVIYVNPLYAALSAYNALTGQLLWSVSAGGAASSDPTIDNGVIYIGGGSWLYAVNALSGKVLWSVDTENTIYTSPAVANGIVYIGSGLSMLAYSTKTHALLWSYATHSYILSSPTVENGVIYFGSDDDNVYALNAKTGIKIWAVANGQSFSDTFPAIANGFVYVNTGDVTAFNARTGKQLWQSQPMQGIYPDTPRLAVANGIVFTGSYSPQRSASVYAFDAQTGAVLWTYTIPNTVEAYTPVVVNGMLFIAFDATMYAFHLPGH